MPAETIVKKMRDSTDSSQLAHLHGRGVSDSVIDYMQQSYLEAVRR